MQKLPSDVLLFGGDRVESAARINDRLSDLLQRVLNQPLPKWVCVEEVSQEKASRKNQPDVCLPDSFANQIRPM